LHFKNGFLAGPLAPGKHVFFGRGNSVISYDRRQREIVVKGQDLLTADGVTVNVNVAVHFSLSDAAKLFTSAGSPKQVLSSAVQLALRELVEATSIDRFLERESSYAKPLTSRATSAGAAVGLAVERVEIRDVIPGGVLRERSEALAEVERARGKVASLQAPATPPRILERNLNQFRPSHPT
ncbi:MAG: SPFH domain-containing protein, partial [Verrucomicrobiales bacterium]